MKEHLYHIITEDNEQIALWKYSAITTTDKHIFLTHGTFSSRKILDGIAFYLNSLGYNCWIMEWRNHGDSARTTRKFGFDTLAKFDLKSTFNYLFNVQGIEHLDCIAHSGGGIILTMFLINNPAFTAKVNSITLFGVQAFGAGTEWSNRIKIFLSKYFSAMLGYVPANMAGSSEDNESYYMMKQWFDWNLTGNFVGRDGYDYKNNMKHIRIPVLSICGKGDDFIAPKIGCEKFLNAFENHQNQLVYLSKENGYYEDYNHSRLIKSTNAKREIWPIVASWIDKHQNSD